jgi:hypothetical protein
MTIIKASLNERELAGRWSTSIKTLQAWRQQGKGPKYLKIGRAVRYPIDSIEQFESKSLISSTSAEATV